MRIIVGIGGGIAAYKATVLLRLFSKAGHDVVAMPTASALEFIGQPTLEALSGNPVNVSVFERIPEVNHVRQADEADAIVIAPATADLMARLATGRADDLLSATVLTTHAPVILAPAMHTQMWEHPATARNVQTLCEFGYHIIEPAVGRLTGPDSGKGRLPEPEEIFEHVNELLTATEPEQVFAGRRVLVTAGGTREPLDPVRFLSNKSTGKQGIAVARAASDLGAEVTLIGANLEVEVPENINLIRVSSTAELQDAVHHEAPGHDVLVMSAAVADFKPAEYAEHKIKKTDNPQENPVIVLERNPDILKETVELKRNGEAGRLQTIVGFAAETGSPEKSFLELGREKLARKGCEFLVVNRVGGAEGFGSETNTVTVLSSDGSENTFSGSKYDVSLQFLKLVASYSQ